MMIKATPVGLIEPDSDRKPPAPFGRYLWRRKHGENGLAADPTRTVCLNCTACPEWCEQSDALIPQLVSLEEFGALHCLLAFGRMHRLTTVEIGEAGAMTLARGLSVTAYKNYVRQIEERKRVFQ